MSLLANKKLFIFLLIVIAAVFGFILVYSDQGFMQVKKLEAEQNRLQMVNDELKEENRRLQVEIDRLKSDPKFIEDEARNKLGLIRPDETIYRLKEEGEKDSTSK